jgi:hypothetical protein
MSWKTSYRSIYYEGAPEPDDLVLPSRRQPFLIDVQNTYLEARPRQASKAEQARLMPDSFHERMPPGHPARRSFKLCRAKALNASPALQPTR